ncbi:MAG: sugar transferase, partial [Bacteroidota bacterium]|nr:sugar transferase [Bacteroidota bacterium]
MSSDKSFRLRLLFAFGDVVHLIMSLLIAHRLTFFNIDLTDNYIFLNIIFILFWLVSAYFFRLFSYERGARIDEILLDLLKAIIVHLLIISTFLSLLSSNHFSKECVLYSFFISYTLLFIWRSFSLFLIKKYRKLGYNYKQVVLIGKVDKIPSIIQFFTKKEHGYKLIAFFSDTVYKNKLKVPSYPISHLEDFCFENKVEEMYYSESIYNSELLDKIIRFCDDSMIRLKIIPDFSAFKQRKFVVDFYSSRPVITLREEPLQDEFNRILKRFFDIIFSLIVIGLILSWLVPLIATLIKLTSKGPVFFVQRRSGLDNKEFNCL